MAQAQLAGQSEKNKLASGWNWFPASKGIFYAFKLLHTPHPPPPKYINLTIPSYRSN